MFTRDSQIIQVTQKQQQPTEEQRKMGEFIEKNCFKLQDLDKNCVAAVGHCQFKPVSNVLVSRGAICSCTVLWFNFKVLLSYLNIFTF